MGGPHEGALHGVPAFWSWGSYPEIDNPPNTSFQAVTAWGQIYADAAAIEPASGVRVEIKNMESYVWSLSQQTWIRAQATTTVDGAHYLEDFGASTNNQNFSVPTDLRTEPDGGTSSGMVDGYNFHFWPSSGRANVPAFDIGGVFTTYQARLTGPNAASAKYLANVGGDWWVNLTAPYNFTGPAGNNNQIGEGRFMYLNTTWQAIDFYTGGPYSAAVRGAWTQMQLQASPPPLDAMGLP
jgi:hypothetical protein